MLGLLLIPFPVSLAISVYRHQLFDIDIIIRKTLLYTSLTIVLGMAYFGGIVLLQNLFRGLPDNRTSWQSSSRLLGSPPWQIRCESGFKRKLTAGFFAPATIPSRQLLHLFPALAMKSISLNCRAGFQQLCSIL